MVSVATVTGRRAHCRVRPATVSYHSWQVAGRATACPPSNCRCGNKPWARGLSAADDDSHVVAICRRIRVVESRSTVLRTQKTQPLLTDSSRRHQLLTVFDCHNSEAALAGVAAKA